MLFWAIIGLKYRAVYIGGKEMIGKTVRDEKIDKKMQVFSSSNAFLVQLKNASRCGIIDMLFPSYSLHHQKSKLRIHI